MNDKIKFSILAVICIIVFCVAITPITFQNDTFYAIKVGEHIVENGIDMQDPFSWHEGLSYVYPHWAFDTLIYLIYLPFGMKGIYISTCILSALLGLVIYGVNNKLTKNNLIAFFITIISMFILKGYIAARAQLVTFILFMLTILFIEKFLEKKEVKYVAGLMIISLLIANLHVAVWPFFFILFLPYIGEYIMAVLADRTINKVAVVKSLERKIKRLSKKPGNESKVAELKTKLQELNVKIEKIKEKRQQEKDNSYKLIIKRNDNTKYLIIVMIICSLMGLITPIGDTPYTYLAKTMFGNTTQNINEHLPMTLMQHEYIMSMLILYLAILTFTKVKIRLKDLFLIGGLTFLMLYSRRQATMFIMIGSVVLSNLLIQLEALYASGAIEKITKALLSKVGIFVTIALTLIVGMYFIQVKKGDKFVDESAYPVKACDYILENIDINNMKIYNDYNYGSYLIYRGIPVFIDARADLYAPEFNTKTGNTKDGKDIFTDFLKVSGIETYYDDVFKDYQITHVITPKNSKMNLLISKRDDDKYKKLYEDDNFVFYEILKKD